MKLLSSSFFSDIYPWFFSFATYGCCHPCFRCYLVKKQISLSMLMMMKELIISLRKILLSIHSSQYQKTKVCVFFSVAKLLYKHFVCRSVCPSVRNATRENVIFSASIQDKKSKQCALQYKIYLVRLSFIERDNRKWFKYAEVMAHSF